MLLEECNYNSTIHDLAVEQIKQKNPSIEDAIVLLAQVYFNLYGVNEEKINCGMCNDFGNDICRIIKDAEGFWGDELICDEKFAYHYVVKYKDKFYDSEHPDGEYDLRNISSFNF